MRQCPAFIAVGALLALLTLPVACGSSKAKPDANGDRADRPEATSPSQPAPARAGDIEQCATALDARPSLRDIVDACRTLWLTPACRDAWIDSLARGAGTRGEYVMRTCAAAYCDDAAEDLLLCTAPADRVDLLDPEVDWLDAWADFNGLVLNRDLGLDRDDPRGGLIARRLLQLVASAGVIEPDPEPTDADET